MDEFIYEKDLSLSTEYCDFLIDIFESNKKLQSIGKVGKNYNDKDKDKDKDESFVVKDVKNTIDISIDNNISESSPFFEVHKKLKDELFKTVIEYYNKLDPTYEIYHTNLIHKKLCFNGFLMTKYLKNKGFFQLHNDFFIDNNRYRLFNFIWYLNDVDEGGKTLFFDNGSIKPKKGKLAIFPSEWFISFKLDRPIVYIGNAFI